MKPLAVLCLHALILLALAPLTVLWPGTAGAVDFKGRGQWVMSFGYGMNGKFVQDAGFTGFIPGQDNFNARQKVALQLDAEVSRTLSGSLYLDIGDIIWGQQESAPPLSCWPQMMSPMSR